jgi:putative ABC transport system permease protein
MEYLHEQGAVPDEAAVLLGLSLLFLVVCLLNTIGLLLAKFLGKATEIGIRRALGASRRVLFHQYLVEAGSSALPEASSGSASRGSGSRGSRCSSPMRRPHRS